MYSIRVFICVCFNRKSATFQLSALNLSLAGFLFIRLSVSDLRIRVDLRGDRFYRHLCPQHNAGASRNDGGDYANMYTFNMNNSVI